MTRALALIAVLMLSGCGYNTLQSGDEQIKAAWSEVLNQYQRRADLVPNLVETVKGAAKFEKETFTAVTQARARVAEVQGSTSPNDPAAVNRYKEAQDQLSTALSRLLVVVERYPDLKATQAFRDLQVQLEGAENRIAVERMRFVQAAQAFNSARDPVPTAVTQAAGPSPRTLVTMKASEIVEVVLTGVANAQLCGITSKRTSPETTAPLPIAYAGSLSAADLNPKGTWAASLFVQTVDTGTPESANVAETAIGAASFIADCTFNVA